VLLVGTPCERIGVTVAAGIRTLNRSVVTRFWAFFSVCRLRVVLSCESSGQSAAGRFGWPSAGKGMARVYFGAVGDPLAVEVPAVFAIVR
jgi:hypothetical protein